MWTTGKQNTQRVLQENNGKNNHDMGKLIQATMAKIYPWKLWEAHVYHDIGGLDNHAFICYGCFDLLHWDHKYNVVVAGVDKTSKANTGLINKDYRGYANDGGHADSIRDRIWNSNNCYYGVHVIKRAVDEWTWSDFGNRMKQEVGSKKTVIVWALNGVCHKK